MVILRFLIAPQPGALLDCGVTFSLDFCPSGYQMFTSDRCEAAFVAFRRKQKSNAAVSAFESRQHDLPSAVS